MTYTESIFWFATWPIVIYAALKFAQHNLNHFHRLERLEAYEKKYGDTIELDD